MYFLTEKNRKLLASTKIMNMQRDPNGQYSLNDDSKTVQNQQEKL